MSTGRTHSRCVSSRPADAFRSATTTRRSGIRSSSCRRCIRCRGGAFRRRQICRVSPDSRSLPFTWPAMLRQAGARPRFGGMPRDPGRVHRDDAEPVLRRADLGRQSQHIRRRRRLDFDLGHSPNRTQPAIRRSAQSGGRPAFEELYSSAAPGSKGCSTSTTYSIRARSLWKTSVTVGAGYGRRSSWAVGCSSSACSSTSRNTSGVRRVPGDRFPPHHVARPTSRQHAVFTLPISRLNGPSRRGTATCLCSSAKDGSMREPAAF